MPGLRPATLFKLRLWNRCFPMNFAKFLRTPFHTNSSSGCFCRVFLKFSQISQGSLFNIVAVLRLWPWDFPVKFAKFLRTAILKNICQRLLLNISKRRLQVFSYEFCELFKNIYFKKHIQTDGSKTPVRQFLFNKVASLMVWRSLTVLEKDYLAQLFFC